MKTFFTTLILFISSVFLYAGNPQKISVTSGGYNREYLLYIPKSYTPQKEVGLIVCLHGFNRTMEDFFNTYPIAPIADSLNLIVLAPQALPEQDPEVIAKSETLASLGVDISLNAAWACGLRVKATMGFVPLLDVELNVPVDDVGFIRQIIQTTSGDYSIDPDKLFIFGTSMGGFMSYQYAMLNGNDLAGLVSICGSMGTDIKNKDTFEIIKTPVCDFHSVDDDVVPYGGSFVFPMPPLTGFPNVDVLLCKPKEEVIDTWVKKNHAYEDPTIEDVNYYPSTNDKTVKKYTYSNPDGINEVIHYQISHANHEYYFSKANGDCMDYNEEIIKFLHAHMKDDDAGIESIYAGRLAVYPNPVGGWCTVHGTRYMENGIRLYTLTGSLVGIYNSQESESPIDLSGYSKGMYLLKYEGKTIKIIKN